MRDHLKDKDAMLHKPLAHICLALPTSNEDIKNNTEKGDSTILYDRTSVPGETKVYIVDLQGNRTLTGKYDQTTGERIQE